MKYINPILSIVLIACTAVLGSCNHVNPTKQGIEESIEQKVFSKIKSDAPYLAQLSAVYGLVFSNYHPNRIESDDFYIRKDKAGVFYGYSLNDAEIKVIKGKDQNILHVRLPMPKQISVDRRVMSVDITHEKYKPIDSKGQIINVDEWMNNELETLTKKYEEKSIEMTKAISRQYFESLSKRFGLKLNLEFTS